jgi:tRNA(fMet)-specific endonuclease VapC
MEMNYLLDTNILIAFLKGDEYVTDKIKTIERINVSVISVGEMLFGAENSSKKEQNVNLYLSFFKTCKVFPINEKVASIYAKLRSKLKQLVNLSLKMIYGMLQPHFQKI